MGIEKIANQAVSSAAPIVKKNKLQKTLLKITGSDKPQGILENTLDMIASRRKAMLEWVPAQRITVNAKNQAMADKERELIHEALTHNVPMDRAIKGAKAVMCATGELSDCYSAKESAAVFETLINKGLLDA